jgi:hypothetical protein
MEFLCSLNDTDLTCFETYVHARGRASFPDLKHGFEYRQALATSIHKTSEWYRNFHVADAAAREKVDALYAWLAKKAVKGCDKTTPTRPTRSPLPIACIETYVHALYSQTAMWESVEAVEAGKRPMDTITKHWCTALKTAYAGLMRAALQQTFSPHEYAATVACRLIALSKCITTPRVLEYDEYFKTVIRKQLQYIEVGLPEALLVFAHFFPDMVSETCHPLLRKDAWLYRDTSRDTTLQTADAFKRLYPKCAAFL